MEAKAGSLPIILLGLGTVGRACLRQIFVARARFPWLKVVGIADRSGLCLLPAGLSSELYESALGAKERKSTLEEWSNAHKDITFLSAKDTYGPTLVTHLARLVPGRCVVADLTVSQDLYEMHLGLRKAGHHLVLANKWPLSVPFAQYRELWHAGDGALLHETTVGAALPVIGPLGDLVATGDTIYEITASISGTMGYVTSAISSGVPFSEALSMAAAAGYTEPDPRLDLGGVDARRKALILARKLGQQLDLGDVEVLSLVPPDLNSISLEEFWRSIPQVDSRYASMVEEAKASGHVLRYLAKIRPGSAPQVGLTAVEADSVFASTQGTESLFAFHTARYNEQPLVIRGQGAGGELTASGVLADILSIRGQMGGVTQVE